MKKILVLILCAITAVSMLTASSVSAQRNSWKKEAEKSWRDHNELMVKYEEYQKATEDKIDALTAERDAASLLTKAVEAENIQLKADMDMLLAAMQDTAAGLEEQLIQANADKAWAEQRLREALFVLSTPAPFDAAEQETAADKTEEIIPEETPAPIVFPEGELNFSPLTDTVNAIFALPISIAAPNEEAEDTQLPAPYQTPAPEGIAPEAIAE